MTIRIKKTPETPETKGLFTPSPGKKIKFSDGVTMELNRKERRRLKIYNKDLT